LRNRTQFRLDARAGYRLAAGGAVAVVDIDGFRYVNETHGHIIGDALLVEVGAELERRAIGDEVVGRLAGDTFGIFLPGLGEAAEACARVEVFAASFNRPFSTGDREGKEFVRLGATVGVAASTDTNVTIDTLLSRADTAVFAARRNGRGRTLAYEPGMESEEAARDRMLHEMSLAFERGEFEMYFQPHMDLERNRIVACEALIRWNHPTRGLLMPDEFIPFAEQNRSIGAISSYVMQASMDAAEELRAIDPVFRVYFNLSALDLADTQLVESFRAAASAGAPLENIGVEVTETAAIQDMGVTLHAIRSLQELGVCVAIDDFGIGYSSLSVLKRLPVDLIKIDRSFISEVLAGEHDAAISESVIAFGRRFGFATLGEGVETAEQLAWLAERGCRFAQGYHIAVPMPFEAFKLWLTSGQFSPSTVPL
jgi:diguanylate cyclase (GGDEF)-like protein